MFYLEALIASLLNVQLYCREKIFSIGLFNKILCLFLTHRSRLNLAV